MIGVFGAQADDRTVFVIKPPAFLMTLGKLKTFFTPEPLYFLMIDLPPFDTQKCCYFTVAITTILLGKPNQRQA